ncbi:hypothetical protein E4T44_02739 [Aureobasidium sp. EXF-8845]|nr:hypothetical protein E4T44_02739 [Aureobasidium sp. EXF-8845]KAI4855859.1 hypothetical protein E4T45_02696 [Aureobasidium sp. EXF-8846]
MSELLENFSIEDLMTPTIEQGSTVCLSDLDMSLDRDLNLDLDMSDFPVDLSDISTDGFDISTPSVDFSTTDSDISFDSNSGSFNSDLCFKSFGYSDQFAQPSMMPQQFMPMYTPQYPYPSFGCPPGYMLVPAPVFYGQQPLVPMMQPPMQMPVQNSSFSFTPASDAPVYPSFSLDFDEAELMSAISSVEEVPVISSESDVPAIIPVSDVSASTPVKKSRKTRETAAAPVKRPKVARSKATEKPAYELAAPMSVLTADSDIPLRDMLAFANRSVAVRHAEAKKKSGKIPRPCNSFVCYRSAYADRVIQWSSNNSHQNVSRIAGSSWRIESEDIRRFYMNVAELDRFNHLTAFPGWVYNPHKKPSRSTRTASPESDDDDEPTPRPSKKRHLTPLDEDDGMFLLLSLPPSTTSVVDDR